MLTTASNAPHVYIQCDVPDGMTLVEWRRSHSERKPRRFPRRPIRHLVSRLHSLS
jgi:hypothetical protein